MRVKWTKVVEWDCRNCFFSPTCSIAILTGLCQTFPNPFFSIFFKISLLSLSPLKHLSLSLLSIFSPDVSLSLSPLHTFLCFLPSGFACLIFYLCGGAAGWIRAWTGSTNHPDLQDSFSITSPMLFHLYKYKHRERAKAQEGKKVKIIDRDKNKQERTNAEFYEVTLLLCKQGEICQNLRVPLSILSISSVCRYCLEHKPTQRENNGSFAPVMAHSSFAFTNDGLRRWPFGFVQRYTFVFSLSLNVYILFYLNPQDLSHLDEICRSLIHVGKTELLCLPSLFFIYFFIGSIAWSSRPTLGGIIKRLQMRVFSPLHSPQVLGEHRSIVAHQTVLFQKDT